VCAEKFGAILHRRNIDMKQGILGCRILLVALAAGLGSIVPAAAAEEGTVTAFSAWQAQGRTFQTGAKQATFVGALGGPLYVETERGPIPSGTMLCPATLKIGLEDGAQRGEGRCSITAEDGAKAFADVTCTGFYLIGCNGDLKFTGGTGRFAGISGGGKIIVRSELRQIIAEGDGVVQEQGRGIIYLRQLQYKIP
jgi:hypothetical protein